MPLCQGGLQGGINAFAIRLRINSFLPNIVFIMSVIATIDGMCGTFKSRTAKEVAEYFGWQSLSCGMIYRAITIFGYSIYKDALCSYSEQIVKRIKTVRISDSNIEINEQQYCFSDLKNKGISTLTSHFAENANVQGFIHDIIRNHVKNADFIVEGRETSIIFPDARLHFYFYASPCARMRRYIEKNHLSVGDDEFEKMCNDIRDKDERDANRESNPLRIPDNATIIDVDEFGFNYQKVFEYVIETIGAILT